MNRVVHFEIHAENPARAIPFYEAMFGWKFTKWDGTMDYWTIATGPNDQPGINGGMVLRQGPINATAMTAYVCTVDVENLDAALEKCTALGGSIDVPKLPIPGVGWIAYLKDTERNAFSMIQRDPSAK